MFYKLAVFLLLLGCGTIKYPSWLSNFNRDTDKLYGIGTGISPEEAKKVAVNDIASQIRISVSSRSISTMRDDNRVGYEKGFIQDISNKVDDTVIPGYTVVKDEKLDDGRFTVLISVDKTKLIEQYKEIFSGFGCRSTKSLLYSNSDKGNIS